MPLGLESLESFSKYRQATYLDFSSIINSGKTAEAKHF
uniref:Uncharacterized protein n=1 Tax=Tetraselmis sp. GSL018 TaxID=582737 RepID=A0A061SDX0_9CHLO